MDVIRPLGIALPSVVVLGSPPTMVKTGSDTITDTVVGMISTNAIVGVALGVGSVFSINVLNSIVGPLEAGAETRISMKVCNGTTTISSLTSETTELGSCDAVA